MAWSELTAEPRRRDTTTQDESGRDEAGQEETARGTAGGATQKDGTGRERPIARLRL